MLDHEAVDFEAKGFMLMFQRIDGRVVLDAFSETLIVLARTPEFVDCFAENGARDECSRCFFALQFDDAEWRLWIDIRR